MIHHDDALEAVPRLGQFDYVLTDPPYPTGGESSLKAKGSVKGCREMVDGMAQSFIAGVLRAVRLKPDGCLWICCDWRQVSFLSSIVRGMGYDRQSCIVWDKGSGTLSSRYHPSHELILWATAGKPPVGYMGRDVVQIGRVPHGRKSHPFDKPTDLVAQVCKAFPPGRVIDPFCGAGSLLVGAQMLGWECVGVDIDIDACRVARRRLEERRLF